MRDTCPPNTCSSTVGTSCAKRSSTTSRDENRWISSSGEPFLCDLAAVHDDEPVAELLRLVHVVRRKDKRHPLLLQPEEAVPDDVPGLRVEAGRRLVEQQAPPGR